jgi:CDP-paratose 2-epimerase
MKYVITGGCGFLGSNIASEIIRKKLGDLVVFDNLSRLGSHENLAWLQSLGEFGFIPGDIRNQNDVDRLVQSTKPDFIFHLAGQVAMTTSIQNPRLDFETNAMGSFNIIDAIRRLSPETAILYSSTNKVYGDLEWETYSETSTRYVSDHYPRGFPESIPLDFHSPYGCTKGAADQIFLDANRIFGLRTVVFRHSSMFGGRQYSTSDQGWIGWFCLKAIEQKNGSTTPFTISGNGKQVRDVLFAQDMVELYLGAARKIDLIQGQAFNIGGGVDNSLSLLELFDILGKELIVNLNYTRLAPRESDQKVFIADLTKITDAIEWAPKVDKVSGLRKMIDWVKPSNGI